MARSVRRRDTGHWMGRGDLLGARGRGKLAGSRRRWGSSTESGRRKRGGAGVDGSQVEEGRQGGPMSHTELN